MMMYRELFAELGDHCIVEICTIVHNNPFWYTISTYQIVPNKPCHDVLGYGSKGRCFNPLRKVIEILAADTQCHSECYDTVSDVLQDSKSKSSK